MKFIFNPDRVSFLCAAREEGGRRLTRHEYTAPAGYGAVRLRHCAARIHLLVVCTFAGGSDEGGGDGGGGGEDGGKAARQMLALQTEEYQDILPVSSSSVSRAANIS